MRSTRRWAALVIAAGAALVVSAPPSEARPQEVEVHQDRFAPAEVRIEVDETVRWVVRENQHTITSDDGLFDSGQAGPGSIYVARFHNAGRFPYYCSIHGGPGGKGMSGVVIVREKRGAAGPAEDSTTTAPPPAPTTTTSPPPPTPSPPPSTPPAPLVPAAAPSPTTTTTKARPTTSTTAPVSTTTTTVPAPESTTTTAPPPPPPPAPPPDRPERFASGPVPEVPDPPGSRSLDRLDRQATERRLASATRDADEERGSDALVVVGGGLLVVAGLFLVVPGWRTRRSWQLGR